MLALQNQNVLVLGLGVSGMAMARWCAQNGATVTVADTRENPPQLQSLKLELPGLRFQHASSLWQVGVSYDRILRSPGLAPRDVTALLESIGLGETTSQGEVELFSEALRDLAATVRYQPKIIAITGTNGKTTVTALTGQLIQRTGKTASVAGNIGPTLLDTLARHLVHSDLPDVWVLELSSFQLDGITGFEPTTATVLNVTQDHLDWHGSLPAYARAKARIFGSQTVMVLNRDDEAVMAMLPNALKGGKNKNRQQVPYITFGETLPTRSGDFGLETVDGLTWLVRAFDFDISGRSRNDRTVEIGLQKLLPADALRIRGRHNAVNALAGLALAVSIGCPLGPILYGLRDYKGEPHRVQSIGVIGGVEYFDDSKGTNVGATVAALKGLGTEQRLIVILGGDGKGQDFSPLVAPLAKYARAVVLIGRDAKLISETLHGLTVPIQEAGSLEQAVQVACQLAQSGDAVLLSPACASLDMFQNYVHRAEVFRQAVSSLASKVDFVLESTV